MPQFSDDRHNLRLPPELKKRLKHSATDNGRSVNAEIVDRLEKSFAPDPLQNLEALMGDILSLSDVDRAVVSKSLSTIATILAKEEPRR
ncbi:Arc family DNA-binding protein [Rhizobium sp. LC145]|uniref:Arc family DNA-binding protein n=1 Tax=Rhizobium sp. LC145 TaxID=1120688 RepID=UPI00062A1194|nr:Arc family DNA-binding protein [Rhizobium sp. LC145]KKX24333.1 hypothetical protein YH62_27690 [Rhizobium sp. LC145]TKT46150.1 Arc family DNA-binding protein [Rhizobiaceae bacterium LC148]